MKIVVIGGGSSYTPELIEGMIFHRETLPVTEVVLIDVEAGLEKVQINTAFAKRMVEKAGLNISIRYTLDRKEGLRDADFVISQIRVGGLDAREKDEKIPLKYGVIGQETTGPGGCFKALRTIPVMLEICRDMEEVCHNAWLINFTNPSGIITEALLKYSSIKNIGLCNVSINMVHDVSERLNIPVNELDCRFIGLNHLSVMTHAYYHGKDLLQDALATFSTESVVKNIKKNQEMECLSKELGLMLSPYMQYFYIEKSTFRQELEEALTEGTRAECVKRVEKELFQCYQNIELCQKPEALAKRGGARYSEAAINLIDSLYNDSQDIHVVDVANNGRIKQLPPDAVIETTCRIGSAGAEIVYTEEVPGIVLGLIEQVKIYEGLTIEAAVTGNRQKVLQALLANPLVHDIEDARRISEELLEAHKEYLPNFHNTAKV